MPASNAYLSQEHCVTIDNRTIYGQLFTPNDATEGKSLPTVVCAHGFGANYLSCLPFAWDLAEHGFAVYCFDFCGGGYAARSQGNPLDMTLLTEQDDLADVCDMLREQSIVDSDRLCFLGEGQGALVGTLLAGAEPETFRAMALLHPTYNLHDSFRKLFPTKKNIPPSFRQLGMRVGRAYGECVWDINPYTYMSAYHNEVLLLHGDEDVTVPIDYARRASTTFPHASVHVIHGGKHAFKGDAQRVCISEVNRFFSEQVR